MSAVELDPRYDISVRSSGLTRRRRVEKTVAVIAVLSALIACVMLFVVLGSVLEKGVSQIDLSFFTKSKALFGARKRRVRATPSGSVSTVGATSGCVGALSGS